MVLTWIFLCMMYEHTQRMISIRTLVQPCGTYLGDGGWEALCTEKGKGIHQKMSLIRVQFNVDFTASKSTIGKVLKDSLNPTVNISWMTVKLGWVPIPATESSLSAGYSENFQVYSLRKQDAIILKNLKCVTTFDKYQQIQRTKTKPWQMTTIIGW